MASTRRPERPPSSDADRDELWKPMLDSISSGKRLPEKSLLVLGGTPDSQRDFLDAVDPQPRARRPPVANQFALGYTYHDVLDSDHEDTLARLSLYLLSRPSPAFTPLIRPYLTPRTLPHMLVVILLDWNQPWEWVRQLRDWIRVLRSLILSLDDSSKLVLEDNIAAMQATGRPTGPDTNPAMDAVKLPLGPGEWDEPLGIPLCVVCQNANKIETLEKERGWNDDEFDFILQYMRTLLLKHGASLIYTMPSAAGSLQTLLHSTLGIKSLLKQEPLRHNVTDRDRVLVPPNWDSWAKIRILRDGFDAEGVSEKWGVDIDIPQHMRPANPQVPTPADADADAYADADAQPAAQRDDGDNEASATSIYEDTIRNPESDFPLTGLSKQTNGIEVASKDPQTFLAEQVSVLDQLRREDETEAAQRASRKEIEPASRQWTADDASGVVEEHIGPVQFNMGGIHVNADEMVKRLQVCRIPPMPLLSLLTGQ
jgi:dynein light intermediate chain 1